MKAKQYALTALAAFLLAGAGWVRPVLAQDGYDQQQWWNPGDWFDSNPQYNLFSDQYWNNRQENNDSWDYGYNYDWNPSTDYGYYDDWDYNSNYGSNDAWDDDSDLGRYEPWDNDTNSGVGTPGNSESGNDADSDR